MTNIKFFVNLEQNRPTTHGDTEMNVFERIDASILSFFTNISHKFQIWTGRTNFFLANICLTIFSMNVALHVINYWFPVLGEKTGFFELFMMFGMVICIFALAFYLYFTEVTPLPPGKSKVKQWLESFGRVLKPIPVRNEN